MNLSRYKTLPVPPLPRTQALNTTTFCPPLLDGSMTVPEMVDWHAKHSPNHPLFGYADEEGSATTILWSESARAIHRAGRHTLSKLVPSAGRSTVAILAACGLCLMHPLGQNLTLRSVCADTITYFTVLAGIIRAGHIAFPISPRNSPQAVAHLLSKTGVAHVFVGTESALKDLAAASLKIAENNGSKTLPTLSAVPAFEELFTENVAMPIELLPAYKPDWDDMALYMHSSGAWYCSFNVYCAVLLIRSPGSTAFPKPIGWSHYRFLLLAITPCISSLI
jgi:acyl-CoA synthetase (AMP-forming)/AMP-acid ligase II